MDDVAGPAAEDRMELVFTGDGETGRAAVLETLETVPVVPAPRTLADVSGQRRHVADLRRRDTLGRLGEHGIAIAHNGRTRHGIEGHQAADRQAACRRRPDLVEPFDRLQADEHVWRNQPLLHHPEQVAAAASDRDRSAGAVRLGDEGHRVRDVAWPGVGESLHARSPLPARAATIFSRVIGRSFMRTPIALNTALATAAGDGTLLDSPMLLAPKGPSPSSDSMKITSISGASRCVATRAP